MSDVTIYHNPRCSKSRKTLQLIRAKGIEPRIVEYLETPPSADELDGILKKLSLDAMALIRIAESIYTDVNPDNRVLSHQEAIDLMVAHPKLIQRPIVVAGDRAIIGRPPDNVDAIL